MTSAECHTAYYVLILIRERSSNLFSYLAFSGQTALWSSPTWIKYHNILQQKIRT